MRVSAREACSWSACKISLQKEPEALLRRLIAAGNVQVSTEGASLHGKLVRLQPGLQPRQGEFRNQQTRIQGGVGGEGTRLPLQFDRAAGDLQSDVETAGGIGIPLLHGIDVQRSDVDGPGFPAVQQQPDLHIPQVDILDADLPGAAAAEVEFQTPHIPRFAGLTDGHHRVADVDPVEHQVFFPQRPPFENQGGPLQLDPARRPLPFGEKGMDDQPAGQGIEIDSLDFRRDRPLGLQPFFQTEAQG